jgi:hypothetical protein
MRDSDLPHRTKIREEVLARAEKVRDTIKERYKVRVLKGLYPSLYSRFLRMFQGKSPSQWTLGRLPPMIHT